MEVAKSDISNSIAASFSVTHRRNATPQEQPTVSK